jgi:hypothetical protein
VVATRVELAMQQISVLLGMQQWNEYILAVWYICPSHIFICSYDSFNSYLSGSIPWHIVEHLWTPLTACAKAVDFVECSNIHASNSVLYLMNFFFLITEQTLHGCMCWIFYL